MLHPIMPFVTEELWHALTGEPESVLIGRDDYITADEGKIDDKAEENFNFVQRTVEAIRLMRSTVGLAPSKPAEIIVQAEAAQDRELFESTRQILERMSRALSLAIQQRGEELSSREYASEMIGGRARVFLKLEQQSETERKMERERLSKELERVIAQEQQISAKLANASFVERAPAPVIEKEREKHASYTSQIEKLKASIAELN